MGAAAKRAQDEKHDRYMKGPLRQGLKKGMMNKLMKVVKEMPAIDDVRKNSPKAR